MKMKMKKMIKMVKMKNVKKMIKMKVKIKMVMKVGDDDGYLVMKVIQS